MKVKYICENCKENFDNSNDCRTHEATCGKDIIKVAELFAITQTHDENARRYNIFKKTVPISEGLFDKMMELTDKDFIEYFSDYINLDNEFDYIWYEYILRGCDLEEENIKRILRNDKDYYSSGEVLFELKVQGRYGELDTAYISIFEIHKDELDKQDNVNIELEKYLTDNK